MRLNDPLGLLPERTLVALCRLADRPTPVEVRLESGRGPLAVYVVHAVDGSTSELLVELCRSARGSGLAVARAAQGLLPLADRVPQPPPLVPVQTGPSAGNAAFRPRVGRPASAVLVDDPDRWPDVAKALGCALAWLPDAPATHHGVGVHGTRFTPWRGTWAAEVGAWAAACATSARAAGAGIGPVGDRLLQGVTDRLDALEAVDRWQLVHGSLGPEAVAMGSEGAAVDLWHTALLGDGLLDLGGLLALPSDALATVLQEVPADRVDHWRSDGPRRRIEAYHLLWCLTQLDAVGAQLGFDRNLGRLQRLEGVVAQARRALDPGFVADRLARVAPATTWTGAQVDPVAARLRIPLGWLTAVPGPASPRTLCRVLGALLLADQLEGEARDRALDAGWSDQALVRHGPHPDAEPIADRAAWRAQLVAHGLSAGGDAAVLVWLGLSAVDRLHDAVPDGVLRGLERLVRAAAAAPNRPTTPTGRLWHEVVGLAATRALGGEAAVSTVTELGLDLDPVGGAATREGDRSEALAGLEGADRTTPLLVLALTELVGHVPLPGGPTWILKHARP